MCILTYDIISINSFDLALFSHAKEKDNKWNLFYKVGDNIYLYELYRYNCLYIVTYDIISINSLDLALFSPTEERDNVTESIL